MKNLKYLILSALCVSVLLTSCNKDAIKDESQALVEYLESADSPLGKDYISTDSPGLIVASEVKQLNELNKVYLIDIRSQEDFNSGYIENAVNVPATDILAHLEANDLSGYDKIVIVCYTGQTATWATFFCRVNGYANVFAMKFGMASWNADFADKWQSKVTNQYATQFTTTSYDKNPMGDLPVLNTGFETVEEIFNSRLNDVLADGFSNCGVTAAQIFDNPDNYYILNYWPEAHYNIGHIPTAIKYLPKQSLQLGEYLKTLPTDKTIVVYCYTGQGSAPVAAYLKMLGFDAKSLLFGASSMIIDVLAENSLSRWSDDAIMGYDYVQ